MTKILKQGTAFTAFGGSIKLIGLKLKKMFGIDLGITGNNGKNYFKHRLQNKYNVYFMKHWSTFGEIYDAKNQQITNIVPEHNHSIINEHWRGFAHPEIFDRYKNRGIKVGEYNHNFKNNDGPRLVFAREGELSFTFWGVYELDHIDEVTKTKIWKLVSKTYQEVAEDKPVEKKVEKTPAKKVEKVATKKVEKTPAKKPTKKVAKKIAKKPTKKVARKITKKPTKKIAKRTSKKVSKKASKKATKKVSKK